ncbi:hypothetical protein [Catellatospora methionotrophica]|uniref:hypothetical protein n=1 Tax=Catellatospora methionotrophica TaxID=121620 RepID=UPI0033EEAAB1
MSSTAVPVAPAIDEALAGLALQTRRLRIAAWAVGGAGLLVTALIAGIRDDTAWVWRSVAAIVALGVSFGYAIAVRPLRRWRRPPLLLPSATTSGFVTAAAPVSHAPTALLLAVAGFALGSGATWTALAVALLAAAVSLRPQQVAVTPSALRVRRIFTRSVPWAQLEDLRVTTSGGRDVLTLVVDRPGRPPGSVRIALAALDVDPAYLLHLSQHYRAVPQDRTAIGAPAELDRRRAAYLAVAAADPSALDPDAAPAPAAGLIEQLADVIDPGADPGPLPAAATS